MDHSIITSEINRKITDLQTELLSNKRYIFESNDFDTTNLKAYSRITHTVVSFFIYLGYTKSYVCYYSHSNTEIIIQTS